MELKILFRKICEAEVRGFAKTRTVFPIIYPRRIILAFLNIKTLKY